MTTPCERSDPGRCTAAGSGVCSRLVPPVGTGHRWPENKQPEPFQHTLDSARTHVRRGNDTHADFYIRIKLNENIEGYRYPAKNKTPNVTQLTIHSSEI